MNKIIYYCAVIFAGILMMTYTYADHNSGHPAIGHNIVLVPVDNFPDTVLSVLERSCFDCHSERSGNIAAKGKLNFSDWSEYSASKKLNKLDAVCQAIKNGKMPKKKYLAKNPEKKLTEDEIKTICSWAEDEAKKIAGE